MAQVMQETGQWVKRRSRSAELAERWPFAAEVLGFYAQLLDVQEAAYRRTLAAPPDADDVARYVVTEVLPHVVDVSVAKGPQAMMASVLTRFHEADLEAIVRRWLRGGDLPAMDTYLARASAGPVLEALGSAACEACEGPYDDRHCPVCAGAPQLSYFAAAPEDLMTAHRFLECSRCSMSWPYKRMTCPMCGESEPVRLPILGEIGSAQAEISPGDVIKNNVILSGTRAVVPGVQFPHMRIDGCETCSHYTLTINLERDGKAVPLVDEMGAIPLALYASDRGLTKIVPNVMGF